MTSPKKLGKLQNVTFGKGGYDDAMFGISFSFDLNGTGCSDFWGVWDHRSEHASWTEEDWVRLSGEVYLRIMRLMQQAKVKEVHALNGIPIEVEFEGNVLKSWRVLEEVL